MYSAPRHNLIGRRVTASPSPSPTPAGSSPAGLPSPQSWLDMSQETGVDGVAQATLTDRVGTTRSFVSSAPGTYRTNQRNGLAVLRTTASTAAYLASMAPVIGANVPFCLWFVGQSNGADAIVWGNQTPNTQVRINYTGNRNMFLFNGPSAQSSNITLAQATAWNIYFFTRNTNGDIYFYLNGVSKIASVGTMTGSFNLERFLESYGSRFVGDLGEAGCNAANLSTAQLNSLGTYLSNKWAIAWTPIP